MLMDAEYLGVYLRVEVRGWAQLVNGGQNGDAIRGGVRGWVMLGLRPTHPPLQRA